MGDRHGMHALTKTQMNHIDLNNHFSMCVVERWKVQGFDWFWLRHCLGVLDFVGELPTWVFWRLNQGSLDCCSSMTTLQSFDDTCHLLVLRSRILRADFSVVLLLFQSVRWDRSADILCFDVVSPIVKPHHWWWVSMEHAFWYRLVAKSSGWSLAQEFNILSHSLTAQPWWGTSEGTWLDPAESN